MKMHFAALVVGGPGRRLEYGWPMVFIAVPSRAAGPYTYDLSLPSTVTIQRRAAA